MLVSDRLIVSHLSLKVQRFESSLFCLPTPDNGGLKFNLIKDEQWKQLGE